MTVQRVLVAGSGTMGTGIAASFASAGFHTSILSRDPSRVHAPRDVTVLDALPADAPDLTIESIPEEFELKAAFFARFETAYGSHGILASNTSSLPLSDLAAGLSWPQRFAGVHYYHPAQAFPLVEVVRVEQTSDEVCNAIVAALQRTGKEAVVLRKPVVGYVVNRLQHAILHEAYHLIESGVTRVEEIDLVARLLLGPRMCVTGLIAQKDLSGLEVHVRSHEAIVPTLAHTKKPSPMLAAMLARGERGATAGRGFYDWKGIDLEAYQRKIGEKLRRILAIAQEP